LGGTEPQDSLPGLIMIGASPRVIGCAPFIAKNFTIVKYSKWWSNLKKCITNSWLSIDIPTF